MLLSQGSEVDESSDMAEVDNIVELIDASNLLTVETTVANDEDEALLLGGNNDDDEDEPSELAALDPGATTRPAEITVGATKPRKVKMAALNVMALNDTFAVGEAKLAAKNLVQVRYQRKCRVMREQVTLQDNLYNFLINMGGNFHDVIKKMDTTNTKTESMMYLSTGD
jgi:hypothetical protein